MADGLASGTVAVALVQYESVPTLPGVTDGAVILTVLGWQTSGGLTTLSTGGPVTVTVKVLTAGVQGVPPGLFVVAVMVTVFPLSEAAGMYEKLNGETPTVPVERVPVPLCVKVTLVAPPPKVLLGTVIALP